ncbi:MAG: sirohydrochlorin cobaltochelatase [Candidatus Omnitrophica bacterium]|nr:sirohydrochlorin cobaltochelatase [Candidatus Omnitrophota bacterium]
MNIKTRSRLNRHCAYFPCHRRLEDCTFCYCPFYPCNDRRLGKYIFARDGRKVWSCEGCEWIHRKKTVDNIFNMVRAGGLNSIPLKKPADRKMGVIILGHGSNLAKANDSLRKLAGEIKAQSGLGLVEPAFLQLCEPDLPMVIKKVVRRGCKKVVIVPFFLFMGNHVKRDIPKLIEQEAKRYKEVELVYARNLGQDPRINNIVMDCIKEASE